MRKCKCEDKNTNYHLTVCCANSVPVDVSFEFIPEDYEGHYPYIVVRIKQSQLSPNLRSKIEDILRQLEVILND